VCSDAPRAMYFVSRSNGPLRKLDLELDPSRPGALDYMSQDWFTAPLRHQRLWWSEPYFDTGGAETDLVTVSLPFAFDRLSGVCTTDLTLDQLAQSLRPILDPARVSLMTAEGTVLVGPTLPRGTAPLEGSIFERRRSASTLWLPGPDWFLVQHST
jgi:hypothetical protein